MSVMLSCCESCPVGVQACGGEVIVGPPSRSAPETAPADLFMISGGLSSANAATGTAATITPNHKAAVTFFMDAKLITTVRGAVGCAPLPLDEPRQQRPVTARRIVTSGRAQQRDRLTSCRTARQVANAPELLRP